MLAVCLVKYNESIKFIPITFKPRQGGVNSINLGKILKIGIRAIGDFIKIRESFDDG
jgi:hypothetical protein